MNWSWKDTKRCKQLPHKTPHNVFSQIFNFKTFNHQWQVRCSPHQTAIQIKCKDHYLVYSSNSSCQTYTTATTGLFQNKFLPATILALHFTPVSHCVSHWASCSFEQVSNLFWWSLAGGIPVVAKVLQPTAKQARVCCFFDWFTCCCCMLRPIPPPPPCPTLILTFPTLFSIKTSTFLSAVSKLQIHLVYLGTL